MNISCNKYFDEQQIKKISDYDCGCFIENIISMLIYVIDSALWRRRGNCVLWYIDRLALNPFGKVNCPTFTAKHI